MNYTLLAIFATAFCLHATAQQETTDSLIQTTTQREMMPAWQQVWQEMMENDETDDGLTVDLYDLLQELSEHPINLNQATREELEQLPFLSSQQVMDLIEYRDRYGALLSMGEVRMVQSMDYQQLALLPYFTYLGKPDETQRFPKLKNILKHGRHELTASLHYPLYDRKGDHNGYLGYKLRHWLRYEFSYGKYVRIGLVGAQDAGEPFFANRNSWRGYDYYSYYLQIGKLGRIENLVVGKYKLSMGMGLVMNNSFMLGKMTTLQSLGRTVSTVRPHASRSVADYLQGAAATVRLARPLSVTVFASYRPLDATLNADGTVATLVYTGYHRTPTEMEKKHNTHLSTLGAHIEYENKGLHLGASIVDTHSDRSIEPDTKTLYRRYQARGNHFVNGSVNYRYMHYRFAFNGETAINRDGAVATINALSFQPSAAWSLVALQRFYSYRYTTLSGHAFSEGGHVQNESGIYVGGTWQVFKRLQLKAYADFASFAWPRYRVSQPSSAKDFQGEAIWKMSRQWTLKGRYRLHLKQRDSEQSKMLQRFNTQRARLTAVYRRGEWTSLTQADWTQASTDKTEYGWMVSENVGWQRSKWQLNLMGSYFDTDSYDCRLYVYERQLPREFAFPMLYGNGIRLSVVGRVSIASGLQVDAKAGVTRYFDRLAIGSGLQQINSKTMSDLSLQMRWRF